MMTDEKLEETLWLYGEFPNIVALGDEIKRIRLELEIMKARDSDAEVIIKDLRSKLSSITKDMPSKECFDDMVCFLERSNFGLLPPDGGDGMIPEYVDALNWLRRCAAANEVPNDNP